MDGQGRTSGFHRCDGSDDHSGRLIDELGHTLGVGWHLPPDGVRDPVGLLVQVAVRPGAAASGERDVIGKVRRGLLEARWNGALDISPCEGQDGRSECGVAQWSPLPIEYETFHELGTIFDRGTLRFDQTDSAQTRHRLTITSTAFSISCTDTHSRRE